MNFRISGEIANGEGASVPAPQRKRSPLRTFAIYAIIFVVAIGVYSMMTGRGLSSPPRHARAEGGSLLTTILVQALPLLLIAGIWIFTLRAIGNRGLMRRFGLPVAWGSIALIALAVVVTPFLVHGRQALISLALQALPLFVILGVWAFVLIRQNGALAFRSLPARFQVSYTVTDEGFEIADPSAELRLRWPSIESILRSGDYWVVRGATNAYALPKRFFASEQEERSFLAQMLRQMTPTARAASPDAEKLAAWE